MRKFQIGIKMEMFDGEQNDSLTVYADANNIWEAICAGLHELLTALQEKRSLPSFGAKSSYYGDLWWPDPTKTKRNAEEQREV